VGVPGSASYAGGVFTVNGSGTDIWKSYDQFNFVYQPASGTSGTLIARVSSQTNTSSNAKAGIIWKQSTTAGTNYLLIAVAPAGGIKVQYDFNGSIGGATYAFPNVWMKLVRDTKGKLSAYTSADGVTWTLVLGGKTISLSGTTDVGLFVCSHNNGVLGTATFDNVSWTPGP
jgi:hypothetical protein